MIRRILFAATVGVLLTATMTGVAGAQAPSNASAPATAIAVVPTTVDPAAAGDCPSGYVCFWNNFNFSGQRCQWQSASRDHSVDCSWADTSNVRSVYNHGTSTKFSGVAYYINTNFNNRVGCTRQGMRGNLAGTYKVRSHQWITGSCG